MRPFILSKKEPARKVFEELSDNEKNSLWGGQRTDQCQVIPFWCEGGGTCEQYECFSTQYPDGEIVEECTYILVND